MEKAEKSLQITASLMGLDPDELRRAMTARVMQAAKGNNVHSIHIFFFNLNHLLKILPCKIETY